MEQLRSDSTIVDFRIPRQAYGQPPDSYIVSFRGQGIFRDNKTERIQLGHLHEVRISLGAEVQSFTGTVVVGATSFP